MKLGGEESFKEILEEIKNSQVVDDDGVTEVRRVYNLVDLKDQRPYVRGKEEMIQFLEGEAKRGLSADELEKLGEPEGQFSKCSGVRKSKGSSQRLITNITEVRTTMIQAIKKGYRG